MNQPVLKVVENCSVATFNDTISAKLNITLELNKTGWMFFNSESNPNLAPKQQMRAVGYAEGWLFHEHIANHFANIKEYFLKTYLQKYNDYPDEIYAFYQQNMDWTRTQSQINRDPYWQQVAYTMAHFDGLVLGYQQQCNDSSYLSELDLFIYMSSGDLLDVVEFALPETRSFFVLPENDELNDHCSGLVRITEEEIYVS